MQRLPSGLLTLVSGLDDGPTTCLLHDLLRAQPTLALLDFATGSNASLHYKALEFVAVVEQLKTALTPDALPKTTTRAVASWIWSTNKIEYAGLPEEADTLAAITGGALSGEVVASQGHKEVIQTFEVLKDSYLPSPDITQHVVDIVGLNNWHRKFFTGVLPQAGSMRKTGAESKNLDGTRHVYPHHSVVTQAIKDLLRLVWFLSKGLQMLNNPTEQAKFVAYVFALAAFAQFHLVDIHPYPDGNGRMCRLVCKRLLDTVCPLPFPMFVDREAYIRCLITGRQLSAQRAPAPLAVLLIDSAIGYYRSLLDTVLRPVTSLRLLCSTPDEARRLLAAHKVDVSAHDDVVTAFEALAIGEKGVVNVAASTTTLVEIVVERLIDLDTI